MTQGIIARSIAAEMARGFLEPVWLADLSRKWRVSRREASEDADIHELREFVDDFVVAQRSEVNTMGIVRILGPAIEAAGKSPRDTARCLISTANAAYSTDPIDTEQVRRVMELAMAQLETVGSEMDQVSDALILCRRADDVLTSVETSVTQFLADRDTEPHLFKTAVERDRVAKLVLADLGTEQRYLASVRASLVKLDDRCSNIREDLLRALSSLRTFSALGEQDLRVGIRQNLPPPLRPAPMSFAGGSSRAREVFGGG